MNENECNHASIIGDNYGSSCRLCGKQLTGFGYGGFFGRNLTGKETCIHTWSPMGEGGEKVCVHCEMLRSEFEEWGKQKSDSWDVNDDVVYVNHNNIIEIAKRLSGKN